MLKNFLIPVALSVGSTVFGVAVASENYPTRPVDVVVAVAPGGSVDTVARLISERLSDELGQPFVVNNRPGGSGIVGTQYVARAKPDGYTITIAPAAWIATNPSLFESMPFDPVADLVPIANVVTSPRVLVVRGGSEYESVGELIEYARNNPGKLNFGSAGDGTPHHLSGVLFAEQAELDLEHIPYKGGAPAINDLIGGHIDMMFGAVPEAHPFVQSGDLKALAVTSEQRVDLMPEVPTMAEAGLDGMELSTWVGILGPAGMPESVIQRINQAVNDALEAGLADRYVSMGYEPLGGTPEDFARTIESDLEMYASLIQAGGIQPR